MEHLSTAWVIEESGKYDIQYDEQFYQPYIAAARAGDRTSIAALTRWKNTGPHGRPLNLSRKKQASLDSFLSRLDVYRRAGGEVLLRADFRWRAPVWSIFWCHVLYERPIFDRYTYAAWQQIAYRRTLSREEAVVRAPGHWDLYDGYRKWFDEQLCMLMTADSKIEDRMLDRALFVLGEQLLKKSASKFQGYTACVL